MVSRTEALKQLTAPGEPFELTEATYWGRRSRVFANAPPTLRDIFEASRSDKPFVVYDNERLTYEEVWTRACQLATYLVEQAGVKHGDCVAISMRNYPEWMIAFCAATSIGAIAVALNAMWQPGEMEFALKDCAPKALIVDGERLQRYRQCTGAPDVPVLACRVQADAGPGVVLLEDIFSEPAVTTMPSAGAAPDDDAIILYTSGSTGNPKGAASSHRNIISALLSWELDAQAGVLTGLIPAPSPDDKPAMMLAVPLFHVTGLHTGFLQSFRAQRRLVCMYRWDVERALELIEAEQVTAFVGTPAITGDLVEAAAKSTRDTSSLRLVGGGGSARAPKQVRDIDARFANAKPGTGWGMTETNAIGVGIAGQDYLDHPESSGRASAVLDLRFVGPDGREVPPGERGELQVRGASIFHGYLNRPDANALTFDGEWMKTGDVAYMDADGFVYIVDRIKDLVIRGGENIGCGGVEAALLEHPDVIEACVYGVPDERLGEEVAATVFSTVPVDDAELRTFLAARIARFAIPRYFHHSREPLPRTATGKIFKRELRAQATERLARSAQ